MRHMLVLLVLLALSSAGRADFVPLGDLPGGTFFSIANGVSADGGVVVGYGRSASEDELAFRWTQAGGMVSLGTLDNSVSRANGVSGDGAVVVGISSSNSGDQAFRWTQVGGMVGLGYLPSASFRFSDANGMSADGTVVVGISTSNSGAQAFRWTQAGGMVGLGDLPGGEFFSVANGVSADGTVVVGMSSSASGSEAFRWTQTGGMVGLGDLPGGNFFSNAFGVSADGAVIVGASVSASGGPQAFIWDSVNGMRSLREVLFAQGDDLGGWSLISATDISADGRTIVGHGTNPNGQREAWLARFNGPAAIPEPTSLTLLGLGVLGLVCYARSKRPSHVLAR
jgi:probable HAF family extracellular repeat protein